MIPSLCNASAYFDNKQGLDIKSMKKAEKIAKKVIRTMRQRQARGVDPGKLTDFRKSDGKVKAKSKAKATSASAKRPKKKTAFKMPKGYVF